MFSRRLLTAGLAFGTLAGCNLPESSDLSASAKHGSFTQAAKLKDGPQLLTGDAALKALSDDRRKAYQQLASESSQPLELTVDATTGAVLGISLSWKGGYKTGQQNARAFLDVYQTLLDPVVSAQEYTLDSTAVPCADSVVVYNRSVEKTPVLGSRVTLHLDDARNVVYVTNAVVSVPSVVVKLDDVSRFPGAAPLSKLLGKMDPKSVKRASVLVPLPDGTGLYHAELASWTDGKRFRGAVVVGSTATTPILDGSNQGAGRTGGTPPTYVSSTDTDVPSQVSFRGIGGVSVASVYGERNPIESSFRYLEEHPTTFRTGAARCQFLPQKLAENPNLNGVFSVRMGQRHGAWPVFGADMVLELDSATSVARVTARTRGVISVAPLATVSPTTAVTDVEAMLNNAASANPALKSEVQQALAATPHVSLVVLPSFLNHGSSKTDRLAYRVDLGSFTVLEDALDRAILFSVSGRQGADVVRDGLGAGSAGLPGFLLAEVDGIPQAGAPSPANSDVVSTRPGGGVSASLATYEGMLARNHWLGLNGNGGDLIANTNVAIESGCPNAFFDASSSHQGFFCLGIAAVDVVGHEFTHGIVNASSGMIYADQSGAINEAYADLFGNLIDPAAGWLVGDLAVGGPIRNMANPANMAGYLPRTSACTSAPGSCDSGFVHTNSGIINRAHVVLADGAAAGVPGVRGIGRSKLERLAFNVMTQHLPAAVTMGQVASVTRDVCDLFAARGVVDSTGSVFTVQDCDDVTNAFISVGLAPGFHTGWTEPTLGFFGTQTFNPANAAGVIPTTSTGCPLTNILLHQLVPGMTLEADYDPATPLPAGNVLLGFVSGTAFNFAGTTATAAGPTPLGTTKTNFAVDWFSIYGFKPTFSTDLIALPSCVPPPLQFRNGLTFAEGFDTGAGLLGGSDARLWGNPAPAGLDPACTLTSVGLELLDGAGNHRAGPGNAVEEFVTSYVFLFPTQWYARASVTTAPTGRNMSGTIALSWDAGRTVRTRWVYTYSRPFGSTANCNPL